MDINSVSRYFPLKLTEAILLFGIDGVEEIRIMADKNCFVRKGGKMYDTYVYISSKELTSIFESMCRGSVYAVQQTLASGYITLDGGHRVGVCGKTIIENGTVKHMTEISSLCIRIAREVKGAANAFFSFICSGSRIYNTLIISPPGCGKTTVLRDIASRMGDKVRVCIADERSEISAAKNGVSPYNMGKLTCVMDGVPKSTGMNILLRAMSPDVIITDETGSDEEEQAIRKITNCGVKIITTAHGYSEKDILRHRCLGEMIKDGIFERIVVLSGKKGPATLEKIIAEGKVIYGV